MILHYAKRTWSFWGVYSLRIVICTAVLVIFGTIALNFHAHPSYAQIPPPGFTLETITVPVDGSSVVSSTTLDSGVTYQLSASGTFDIGGPGDGLADAEYADFSNPSATLLNKCGLFPPGTGTDLGIGVNDPNLSATSKVPFWGNFDSTHKYTIDFVGQGAPISLNYHDCFFDDNSGSLTVEILQPTPTSPPPDTDPANQPTADSTANTRAASTARDPINTFNGELFSSAPRDLDLGGPMPLVFQRYYAAHLRRSFIVGDLGSNWRHTFDGRLFISGNTATYVSQKGRVTDFLKNLTTGDWGQQSNLDTPYQLVTPASQDAMLFDPVDTRIYTFDFTTSSVIIGKVVTVEDGHGNVHTITYDLTNGHIETVSDGLGRTLTFTYTADTIPKISLVSDGTRSVVFQYTDPINTEYLTLVTDVRGGTTTYAYDDTSATADHALMLRKTLPRLNVPLTQTYDTLGRVATQTDADGNTFSFSYNGTETTITDPLGDTRVHTHTATGEFSNNTDQAGFSFSLGSDATGRRNAITDRLGDTTTFTYHEPSGQLTSVTNADGTTTNFSFTDRTLDSGLTLHDQTEIVFPDGTTQTMVYDANGNMTAFTDQAGNESTLTYNARGQLLGTTNAAGGVVTHAYNADGTRATRTDPSGNTTTFAYDSLKRLTIITHADGTSQAFTYDNNDNLLTVTDERGQTTTFTYDANNNLTALTDAMGQTIAVAYDEMDRVIDVTDRLGQRTTRTYDALGRLATVTDRTANTTTFSYDARGRMTSMTDGESQVWPRTHDLENILASMADPFANTTTFTSDTMGRLTSLSSPLGNMTDLTYDPMGRVIAITNPNGETTTSIYDARGLLAATTIADGAITAVFERNTLGQLTTLTDPNANDWSRVFDAQGRLTSSADPLGQVTGFDYDTRNRVSRVTLPESTLDLSYDAAGNVTRQRFSDGTDLTFTFDARNRLTGANDLSLEYDANNRITNSNGMAITRDANGRIAAMTLAPGKTVTYDYDRRNLVAQVTDWLGGETMFRYDAAARLTEITRPNGVTTTMTYDQDGRVSSLTEGGIAHIALTRDANGQITGAARSVPLSPRVTQDAVTDLSYDAASQVVSFVHDTLGRVLNTGTLVVAWDLASRLTSVKVGNEAAVTFGYDGLGTRISRTEGMTTREFVVNYALGLPSISVVREGGADLRYDIHTPGGALLYSIEAGDNSRRDYHYDEMGNTIFLTDESGVVIASYAYSPYGEIFATTGSVENPFTWQGRFGVEQEGTSGLYYIRARYYDSATGRFLSRDPVRSISPKSINPYQYAFQNPLRFVDVTGKDSVSQEEIDLAIAEADLAVAEADLADADAAFEAAFEAFEAAFEADAAAAALKAFEATFEATFEAAADAAFEAAEARAALRPAAAAARAARPIFFMDSDSGTPDTSPPGCSVGGGSAGPQSGRATQEKIESVVPELQPIVVLC